MGTRVSRVTRFGAAAGLALLLGVGLLPCGCGRTEEAVVSRVPSPEPEGPPDRRRIPKAVVQDLTACAREAKASAPWRTRPEEMPTYWAEYDLEATEEGEVDVVTLTHSTLDDPGVERCMARALRGMTLPIEQMERDLEEQGPIPPIWSDARPPLSRDARGLVGQTLPLPALGPLIIMIPVVVLGVGLYIAMSSRLRVKVKDIHWPRAERICPEAVLRDLDAQKEVLCNSGYDATCTGKRERDFIKERLDQIPCSKILKSIAQRQACVDMLKRIQEECYGNVTDAGHQTSIDKHQAGLSACEALKLYNCADGHPMANL